MSSENDLIVTKFSMMDEAEFQITSLFKHDIEFINRLNKIQEDVKFIKEKICKTKHTEECTCNENGQFEICELCLSEDQEAEGE